jgi:hypothetical protein
MAYLKNPLSRRVRTNNHVERTNRMFRFFLLSAHLVGIFREFRRAVRRGVSKTGSGLSPKVVRGSSTDSRAVPT